MNTRIPPPLIDGFALFAVLGLWYYAPELQWSAFPNGLAFAIGGMFIIMGVLIALTAIGLFKKKDTTILPFKPEKTSALVTDGIYRITRNPMYLGMALVILGAIFITRQPVGLLALFAACAYLTAFQIKPEERALEGIFGEDYLNYKARVRRWI